MTVVAIQCLACSHMSQKHFHFGTVWGRRAGGVGACSTMMQDQKTLLFSFEVPIISANAICRAYADGKAYGRITLANIWNGISHGGTLWNN